MTTAIAAHPDAPSRPDWLPPAVWPHEPRYALVGEHRVHYVDSGSGPTLLFVGAGTWVFIWRDLIERLAPGFRCVTFDLPGNGLSRAPEPPLGLAEQSQVLEAFVEERGLTDLTLVVHDLGGPIGLAWAVRRPERVRALILMQAFGWPVAGSLALMLGLVASAPARWTSQATNLMARLTSSGAGVGRHLDRDSRRAFRGPFRSRRARGYFHRLMGDARRSDDLLSSIDAQAPAVLADRPGLTVFGEKNDPFGFQDRWHDAFPEWERLVIPKGNHFPMSDDPDLVATTVGDWFARRVA